MTEPKWPWYCQQMATLLGAEVVEDGVILDGELCTFEEFARYARDVDCAWVMSGYRHPGLSKAKSTPSCR